MKNVADTPASSKISSSRSVFAQTRLSMPSHACRGTRPSKTLTWK
jgi:hypothetical protein